MAFSKFTRHQSSNRDINEDLQRLQDKIEESFAGLTSKDHNDSFLLEDVNLINGVENLVEHRLGKAIRKFTVLSPDSTAVVWEATGSTEDKTKYLVLGTTLAVSCSLVVFI